MLPVYSIVKSTYLYSLAGDFLIRQVSTPLLAGPFGALAQSDFFEALSDCLFGILKLFLYLCESLIHRMIASTILVLVPLKFASHEPALLLKF
jgi:hypothetical protein